ncbi:hypothetical protein C8R43DRAFT_1039392 [Mycena crocata]|nr:hypothetical protein C8R43DRAFT_1039392 [Mycena crocata]
MLSFCLSCPRPRRQVRFSAILTFASFYWTGAAAESAIFKLHSQCMSLNRCVILKRHAVSILTDWSCVGIYYRDLKEDSICKSYKVHPSSLRLSLKRSRTTETSYCDPSLVDDQDCTQPNSLLAYYFVCPHRDTARRDY